MNGSASVRDSILRAASGAPWKIVWVHPDIPEKKLRKARKKLKTLEPSDEMLVLVDASSHPIFSEWIVLTEWSVHWALFVAGKGSVSYQDLRSVNVSEGLGMDSGDSGHFLKTELTKRDGSKVAFGADARKTVRFGQDYPMGPWLQDVMMAAVLATQGKALTPRTDLAAARKHIEAGKKQFWRTWRREELWALPLSTLAFGLSLLIVTFVLGVVPDERSIGFCALLTVGMAVARLFGIGAWQMGVMIGLGLLIAYGGHQRDGVWTHVVPNWAVFPAAVACCLFLYGVAVAAAKAIAGGDSGAPSSAQEVPRDEDDDGAA